MKKPLKQPVFFSRKVVFGKKQRFQKKVICDDELLEKALLRQFFLQLLVALGHEKKLHGERVALWIFVEKRQKGILGEALQHESPAKILGDHVAECRFTGTDISLDGNEVVWKIYTQF